MSVANEKRTAEQQGVAPLQMVGFTVGEEEFCVDILKVQEIIRMMEITAMPNAPEYMEGVINLRGKVLPIIDFRKKFRVHDDTEVSPETQRIIVVNLGAVTVGIVVDRVSQVLKLTPDQISPAPDVARGMDTECITGIGRIGEKLIIILELERMFNQNLLEHFEVN